MIPKRVVDIFAQDTSLKTFLRYPPEEPPTLKPAEKKPASDPFPKIMPPAVRRDLQPIRTPADLKRVTATLEEAFSIMLKESKADARHFRHVLWS